MRRSWEGKGNAAGHTEMAKIDTSLAQTPAQRTAKRKKKAKARATAQARVDRLRREANARPRGTAPVHKVKKKKKTKRKIAKRTRVDELVDAQTAGFHTPAEQRAAKRRK